MMKFEKLTDELYGARKAGYEFDPQAARYINEEARKRLSENRIDILLDQLYDNDGDLYRGEDGECYGIVFCTIYDGEAKDWKDVPFAWQRMVHV